MKRQYLKTSLVVVAALLLIGMGTLAFADWGMGYGRPHRGMMGYGPGGPGAWCGNGWGGYHRGPGYGWNRGNLDSEHAKKLEEARQAFFDATRDLRSSLYQKRLALESELAKKAPDAAKAASLQKEISELRAKLDQKRIEHRINMGKLLPEDAPRGGPRVFGMRGGPAGCGY